MSNKTETITVSSTLENIKVVTDLVEKNLSGKEVVASICIAVDELFSNICKYAYPNESGEVEVSITVSSSGAELIFKDWGIDFNPLNVAEPDTKKSASERQIGGLGLFLVKELMDSIDYKRQDNANILTIRKNLS